LKREFLGYPWPGNVREVRNHMERLALTSPATTQEVLDLSLPKTAGNASGLSIDFTGGPIPWDTIERQAIGGALEAAHGNVSEAARLLGLGRGALRYRMARLGHQEPEEETPRKAA
jgi:DNA-binding NtrC family response regulator